MTGIATLRDYVVPTITKAADEAGRPRPRVIASLPVCLTGDVAAASERINKALAIYPTLPSYKAMMDREGAATPADVGLVGTRDLIVDGIGQLAAAGVSEVVVGAMGSREEQDATNALLSELASR
jgi:alkanesulfonate monooxygenase SsuD/methylene tetrahydromethanopterin reductase-like flavin-dependent oxidoreductase (luciferase family)